MGGLLRTFTEFAYAAITQHTHTHHTYMYANHFDVFHMKFDVRVSFSGGFSFFFLFNEAANWQVARRRRQRRPRCQLNSNEIPAMFSFNVLRVALSVCLPVCVREFFLFSFLCVFPFHTSFYVLHVSAAAAVAAVRISACLCLHSFSTGGKLFDDCQYCVEGGHNGAIAFIGTSQAKQQPPRPWTFASEALEPDALCHPLPPSPSLESLMVRRNLSVCVCVCVCACVMNGSHTLYTHTRT